MATEAAWKTLDRVLKTLRIKARDMLGDTKERVRLEGGMGMEDIGELGGSEQIMSYEIKTNDF